MTAAVVALAGILASCALGARVGFAVGLWWSARRELVEVIR